MDESRQGAEPVDTSEMIVLDASVLYPMALRDLLLRLAAHGLYLPRWSAQILEEVRRNLVAHGRSDEVRAQRLLAEMRRHFLNAEVNPPQDLVERMTNAVEDRHVLATAVEASAGTIVTSNLRDFPLAALVPLSVDALSPDAFLGGLLDAAPDRVLETLREQAAELINPPKSVEEVLSVLAIQAPDFVTRVRAMIR